MAFFIPALMGAAGTAARFGGMALARGAGVAKSGLRAAGSVGKGALGFGAGAALAGGGQGNQTAVPSSNEQSMDNVIPFPAAAGGGRRGGGSSGGVSTAQATSALQDGDSSNPTVNALNDIREVLVNIKGDTATIASGFSVPKAESPDENKLNAMFGGKGGGKGLPTGSAGMASAVGGMAALTSIFGKGLFGGGTKTDEEKLKEVSEKLEDGVDNFSEKLTQSLVTQGNKLIASKTLVGGTVDAAKTGLKTAGTALKNKVTGTTPGLDASGKPAIDSSKVVGTDPQGRNVVQSQKGNFTVQGADGKPTTNMVKPQDIQGAKIKIDAPEKAKAKGLAKAADLASSFLKNVGKYGIKQVPLVGAAAGLGMAAWRLMKGDKAGAAAELAGVALVGPVGGVTIDAGLLARDMYNDAYGNPEGETTEEKFPHDTDAATPGSGYGEKYKTIYDYVMGKLKEMKENFGKSDIEKPTSARPEVTATGGRNRRSQKMAQERWDKKFGDTHNEDGSLKAPSPEMQITETTGADLIGAPTPAETEGGSITIDAASNQVADAQAGASEEKAMQVAALQSGPLADLGNVVSGLGGKVEYLPVLVSDKSVVDTEINNLMVQKNN